MENPILIESLIAKVRELAEESPDFVYEALRPNLCFYATGQNCDGCIFGQALLALGVEKDVLEGFDQRNLSGQSSGIEPILDLLDIGASERQKEWCTAVQRAQDRGASWSEAVKDADETYPLN